MARYEFLLPDIGEGLAEVELVKWLVALGDTVQENQPVADVESDKAVVTMPAPASGRITEFCVQEGERVKVGHRMLVMDTAQGASSPGSPDAAGHRDRETRRAESAGPPAAAPAAAAAAAVQAAPAVRRRARELNVALEAVRGSGPGGRITMEDLERHAQRSVAGPPPAAVVSPDRHAPAAASPSQTESQGAVETIPFRGIRRRIAEAMERSARTIPHVTGFHEFDAEALVRLVGALKGDSDKANPRLTFLPFIVKAAVHALRAHPVLNASLDEEGQVIQLKKFYNIGIATATPDGLMVPVVQQADRLGLLQIAREIDRLASTAREGRLQPADLHHGTFTITNVGGARGWLNTSLIRPPEVAILGVGRVEERAVVRDGRVVARPVMPLALTFDHRVIDGDEGLGFMLTLRDWLEHPERLLLQGTIQGPKRLKG